MLSRREKISELINDENRFDELKEFLNNEISESDVPIIMDLVCESRMNSLFKTLKIDEKS